MKKYMHSFLFIYSLPAAISTITKLGNWPTNQLVQERSVVYSLVTDTEPIRCAVLPTTGNFHHNSISFLFTIYCVLCKFWDGSVREKLSSLISYVLHVLLGHDIFIFSISSSPSVLPV